MWYLLLAGKEISINSCNSCSIQQAVEEKYKLCDETLSKLLAWIGDVEDKLANQDIVQEDTDELRNQINIMKVSGKGKYRSTDRTEIGKE